MNVNQNIFLMNPFIDAYVSSDWLGKFIFIGLVFLSVCSWVILIHKIWLTYRVKKNSAQFYAIFQLQRTNPLGLECENITKQNKPNPFFDLYSVLKKQTMDILNKNRKFGNKTDVEEGTSYLSPSDVDFVDTHLLSAIASQIKQLEKNLFILSTTVSLGPFLGLLGTVWGILTTFSELQTQGSGATNQMVLGGLSLALATTVLGLLDAIPALIGYNYLRNVIGSYQTEMEGFSTEILAAVELQYRRVDHR
jgi:biopolymer transport protein TolQ